MRPTVDFKGGRMNGLIEMTGGKEGGRKGGRKEGRKAIKRKLAKLV